MGATLLTRTGSSVDCWIERISEVKPHKTVIGELPTASLDYIQNLGAKNRTFVFSGGVSSAAGISQLRSLPGYTGSITMTNDYGISVIPLTQLFYINMDFTDDAKSPVTRKFTLNSVEVL